MTEQELVDKIATIIDQFQLVTSDYKKRVKQRKETAEATIQILALVKEAGWIDPKTMLMPGEFGTPRAQEILAQWAEDNGYVKLDKFDLVVKKPPTGLPTIVQFTPEEYQPILGDIPPEEWELTGYDSDLYQDATGRQVILKYVQLDRAAKARWDALSPEKRAELLELQEESDVDDDVKDG